MNSVGFIAQGFYAYRISILAQSYWVPGVVSLVRCVILEYIMTATVIMQLAIIQLGGAIASSVIVKEAKTFSRLGGYKFNISSVVRIFIYHFQKIWWFEASTIITLYRFGMEAALSATWSLLPR